MSFDTHLCSECCCCASVLVGPPVLPSAASCFRFSCGDATASSTYTFHPCYCMLFCSHRRSPPHHLSFVTPWQQHTHARAAAHTWQVGSRFSTVSGGACVWMYKAHEIEDYKPHDISCSHCSSCVQQMIPFKNCGFQIATVLFQQMPAVLPKPSPSAYTRPSFLRAPFVSSSPAFTSHHACTHTPSPPKQCTCHAFVHNRYMQHQVRQSRRRVVQRTEMHR